MIYINIGTSSSSQPVGVSFEHPRYYVNESSGLFDITIVASHKPKSAFTVKLTVLLGSHQTKHGKAHFSLCKYNNLCVKYNKV